jgi:hypothetical protein
MPNEGLIVPNYPKPVTDLSSCRRSSLSDTVQQKMTRNSHLVVPLMSSTNIIDASNHSNVLHQGLNKIDPVAISLAAKAKRQQQHDQEQQQHIFGAPSSPSQSQKQHLSPIYTNRRASLDANVEYAVAMVNIVNPSYDMDDRDMCPFGTRRDSVCGGTSNNTGNVTIQNNNSPTQIRRRILKKEIVDDANYKIDMNDPNNVVASNDTAFQPTATNNNTIHSGMKKIATISLNDNSSWVGHNHNGGRPLTLTERIHFH